MATSKLLPHLPPESRDGLPVTTGAVIPMLSPESAPATLLAGLPNTPINCKKKEGMVLGGEGVGVLGLLLATTVRRRVRACVSPKFVTVSSSTWMGGTTWSLTCLA